MKVGYVNFGQTIHEYFSKRGGRECSFWESHK